MSTSTSRTHGLPPPFRVYLVWHAESEDCSSAAERIRDHYRSPRFQHMGGSDSMDVVFQSYRIPGDRMPGIALDVACPTAVVVMVDRRIARSPEWGANLRKLGRRAEAEGPRVRLIPILMESSLLNGFQLAEQAIRLDEWGGAPDRQQRLLRALTYEFVRMLRHHLAVNGSPDRRFVGDEGGFGLSLDKIQVFLSHSKGDAHGEGIATRIRDWLHNNSALSSFLDVYDIPPGLQFSQVIKHQVERSIMLAIRTDSFSSREWCRREVVAAKATDLPMVVVDCLDDGDDRAFPYLGNVPVVRMNPVSCDRIPSVVSRVLDETLRHVLWRARVGALRASGPVPTFIARPPEFAFLASRGVAPGREGSSFTPVLLSATRRRNSSRWLGATWSS